MAEEKKEKKSVGTKKEKKEGPTAYIPHKYCPKCGAGVRLAEHKDRRACGKCGYYEKK